MSIFRLEQDFFETFSLEANPSRTFVSSSSGLTGAIYLFAQRSPAEKEAQKLSSFEDRTYGADSIEGFRQELVASTSLGATNFYSDIAAYMDKVTSQSISLRKQKQMEIIRFMPSVRFTSDTLRKNVVREILFPYYQTRYPTAQWGYTNYHTLNFFTSSDVPTGSCMIYPVSVNSTGSKAYFPSSSFTFDFYINPRYTTDNDSAEFKAGTLFHMSSSYALSLVSGSSVGANGRPNAFRLLLQLSASAQIKPSIISLTASNNSRPIDDVYRGHTYYDGTGGLPGSYPIGQSTDLIFLSNDNSLSLNTWHHVGVRWAGTANDGTGSFVIDGAENGTFVIPSASCMAAEFEAPLEDPNALFIGNFWDAPNDTDKGELTAQFFNSSSRAQYGVIDLFGGDDTINDPNVTATTFAHPLNAEVHDLKIYNSFRTLNQLLTSSASGSSTVSPDLIFYVPPFFVKESRKREVLQTMFQSTSTRTDDPFNVALSFGVGGHLLNLENFVREFARKQYPRLWELEMSTLDEQTDIPKSCNAFLFATASTRKRNLTVLPCDNGKFVPGFQLLSSGSIFEVPPSGSLLDKYTNDFGALDFSYISLTDLIPTSTLQPGLFQYPLSGTAKKEAINISADPVGKGVIAKRLYKTDSNGNPITSSLGGFQLNTGYPDAVGTGSIAQGIANAGPENPGVTKGAILTIFQRNRDNTSDEVVFFDSSNLFYGKKIKPESFSLTDSNVTGSGGKVAITLKDDGRGNLYRADAVTPHAKWSSVGSLLYEEGIAVVKSPNIPLFGKDQFKIDLKGVQNIHILEINVPCGKGSINSSSNPAYAALKPSDYADTVETDFVYVTGLNFHDENLNIIARTNLAQPLIKRNKDKFKFRVKIDF